LADRRVRESFAIAESGLARRVRRAGGTSFDRAKWTADTGGAGFGNQERE